MTIEEAKQLEVKIANSILNTIQFAQVVQILSAESTRRAKDIVDNASEEELTKIKEDFEKSEAELKPLKSRHKTKLIYQTMQLFWTMQIK